MQGTHYVTPDPEPEPYSMTQTTNNTTVQHQKSAMTEREGTFVCMIYTEIAQATVFLKPHMEEALYIIVKYVYVCISTSIYLS